MKTSDLIAIPSAIVPDRVAISFEGKDYTYEQFAERVNRVSSALAKLGIGKGDRVALLQVNTSQFPEVYFATSKLGAMFVPLNYRARADELEFMLNSAEASTILVGAREPGHLAYLTMMEGMKDKIPSVKNFISLEVPREGWLNYDEMIAAGDPDGVENDADDEDTTILMYTAGTTGFPKGALLSHQSFTSFVLNNVTPADPDSHDINLLVIPLYHVAGIQGMMASVYGGRTLFLQRQFVAEDWMKGVVQKKVTNSVLVPTMVKMVIDHADFAKYDLSSLKQITYGAAPMPFEVIKKAIEVLPHVRFMNAFGQTETAATVTALGPEDHDIGPHLSPQERELKLKRLSSSIGKPLADTEVKVFDENTGTEVPAGVAGEIWARGARVMSGYWKMPEASASTKTKEGWVRTGDLGYFDEDGYLYLAGRAKDIIIRAGENISPEEVENVIYAHPAVDEVAVIGFPEPQWGEGVRAVVVLKKGQTATAEEIIEFCRTRIASFKRPESVVFIDELPRNPMGKVLKRILREQHGQATPAS